MNNLERDSKQYDVLVMEMSTQEKTMRDSDWCVPVKHVAKLSRMRGSTSAKMNIKFFVDPEENRDNDTAPDCLGSEQFDLEDDVSYKCSCCEADGTRWKRTRSLTTRKRSVRFSSLTDADINFFEKVNADASFNKALGRRCQSLWLSIQELEKPSRQWIDRQTIL